MDIFEELLEVSNSERNTKIKKAEVVKEEKKVISDDLSRAEAILEGIPEESVKVGEDELNTGYKRGKDSLLDHVSDLL